MMQTLPIELLELIHGGESITVEFKKSTTGLNKDIYETICAFSNRYGGHIFLGINDKGEILGIDKSNIDKIKKEFITSVNNENKMFPPLYLTPIEYEIDGKHILYIRVPASKDVCHCNGRIYDRNHDSDTDITYHSYEVSRLYLRKSSSYFVNRVTGFGIDSLRSDLIERARNMTRIRQKEHPWRSMSDEELLRSTGLILKDENSQREGVTIAAILLFGTDSTIMSVLPQHKTDAIFRVFNTDRYDDRDVVITNLIESYDRLMSFGQKHLNDTFHLDGIQSVSARDNILREIISNLLAHRDFSSGYVPKLVIEKNRIFTENANLPHSHGALKLATFEPFPKNPPISKVFCEIGFADELGSGMRNTYKYTKMYSGAEPQFIEGDVFRITIPLSEVATATVGPASFGSSNEATNETISETINEATNGTIKLTNSECRVLQAIQHNSRITRKELIEQLHLGDTTVYRAIKKLKTNGLIKRIGSNKTGYWKLIRNNLPDESGSGLTISLSEVATATVGPASFGSSNEATNETISETINEATNGTIKLTNSECRVLQAIQHNSRITRKELIEQLHLGDTTVYRAIKKLKTNGLIKRIGSNKTGYWEILKIK